MSQSALRSAYGVVLHVSGSLFSLAGSDIHEILRAPRLTRVPHGPAALDGVANLRGHVVPVFSLARLLGLPGSQSQRGTRIIVLHDAQLALLVDGVSGKDTATDAYQSVSELDLDAITGLLTQTTSRTRRAISDESTPIHAASPGEATEALLGFELAGQQFAFPLSFVDEVRRQSGESPVSASDDGVTLGVISSGDAVLPLVSLRALLGFQRAPLANRGSIIVGGIGESRIGFVVDRVSTVIRARSSDMSRVPAILNRGAGEAKIASIYRAARGVLVSVLSPDRIFADQAIAHASSQRRLEQKAMSQNDADAHGEQIIVFQLGDEEYGLPLRAVDEIARMPKSITRIPRAPAFVEGVMNLRGRVIPLIDQGHRFAVAREATTRDAAQRRRVLVTRIGELQAGFVVDKVTEILRLSAAQLQQTPALAGETSQTFDRVAVLDVGGRMILLVDPQQLLDRVEGDMLASLAAVQSELAS
jgi:purine-binding chemotaxis protein CheW